MTTHIKRPVLRWHGGKHRLAPWLLSHFPPHEIYVEPFGGAASVLMIKARAKSEVYNDMDGNLVSLFRVLRDPSMASELQRALQFTPFSREEFENSYEETTDPVESARRLVVRSFMGYGSKSCVSRTRNGFRSLRTGEKPPAWEWAAYSDSILLFCERLGGVVIENKPALDVIQRYDRPNALLYLDPPYVHSTRNLIHGTYHFEMSDEDHRELATVLHDVQGMAVLSGYDTQLYRELYSGWRMVTRKAYADKASPRTECLWISPKTDEAMPLLRSVGGM